MSPCQQPLPRTSPGTGPPDPASLAPVPEVNSLTRTRRLPFSPTRPPATRWGARPSAGSCGDRGLRGGGSRGAPRHPPTPDPSHLSLQAPVHSTRPHGFRSRSSRSLVKPSDTYGRHGHWGAWCLDTSGSPPPPPAAPPRPAPRPPRAGPFPPPLPPWAPPSRPRAPHLVCACDRICVSFHQPVSRTVLAPIALGRGQGDTVGDRRVAAPLSPATSSHQSRSHPQYPTEWRRAP